jgi:hypothetical protein
VVEEAQVTETEQADELAANVCRVFSRLDSVGMFIRTTADGNVRIISPVLPRKTVAAMLRYAADAYEAQAPDVSQQ